MFSRIKQQDRLSFMLAIVAVCTIMGPTAPFINTYVYYVAMALFAITSLGGSDKRLNIAYIILILGAVASLITNNVAPVFKAWQRLIFFILMSIPISPMIESQLFMNRRLKALNYMLWLSVFVGIVSFFCYLVGVNYMYNFVSGEYSVNSGGWFGGITVHSMLLGPVSALGACYMTWYSTGTNFSNRKNKNISIACIFLCLVSTILTASRGSVVAAIVGCAVVYMLRKGKVGTRMTSSIISLLLIGILIQPLLKPFSAMLIAKQEANIAAGGTFDSRQSKWHSRIEEFESNPFFGSGFCSVDIKSGDYYGNGKIEPGSSWLAVLSMLGILGVLCIWIIVFKPMIKLYKRCKRNDVLLIGIFCVFLIHMSIEGYIFSGGSFMFFYFWLFVGSVHAYLKCPDYKFF